MSEVILKGLKKVYDNKVTAVHDVNLEIKDKELASRSALRVRSTI